jgi:hypothetical protein
MRSSRPVLTAESALNSRRINSRTISRVHKENSNSNCRGLALRDQCRHFLSCAPESLGGRSGTGLARDASKGRTGLRTAAAGLDSVAQSRAEVCVPGALISC